MRRFRDRVELPVLRDELHEAGHKVPPYLSDSQRRDLKFNPEYVSNRESECLVCHGKGSYKYLGEEYPCIDDAYGHVAMRLARWYWLHNIPLQYQQLIWDEWPMDTPDHVAARDTIESYLDNFVGFNTNGIGLTIFSKYLGTGKTWAATAVLKELVKRGVDGWFVPFGEVPGYYQIDDDERRQYLIDRVQNARVLVLDEVKMPSTKAQKRFFADRLEDLIRPRTNSNFPTIITTNMTMEELEDTFPRVFSLLMAKNKMISLNAPADARMGKAIWERQVETVENGESLPIT